MLRESLILRLAQIIDPEPFLSGDEECRRCERDRNSAYLRARQFLEIVEADLRKVQK